MKMDITKMKRPGIVLHPKTLEAIKTISVSGTVPISEFKGVEILASEWALENDENGRPWWRFMDLADLKSFGNLCCL